MSHIFITGAGSAFGRVVTERLATRHHVVALQHRTAVHGADEVIAGSIHDVDVYRTAVAESDVVVHLAAVTHAAAPELYRKTNVDGTASLLSTCGADTHVVFVSSRAAVAGGGAYADSKRAGEELVSEHGAPFTILQVGEVVTPDSGEGLSALMSLAASRHLLVDLRARPSITYAPISLDDAAASIVASVERRPTGVIVVAAAEPVGARDLQRAVRASGRRCWRLPVPIVLLRALRPIMSPRFFVADQIERLVVPKPLADPNRLEELGLEPRSLDELVAMLSR